MEIPNYEGELIESIEALAILYNISEDRLKSIVNRSSVHYRPIAPIIKENGKIRQIYNVVWPLKRLQRQTVDSIFHRVAYPSYLQGSIKAENGISRDYIVDATRHAAYNIIMRFDIEDFFPSIKYGLVLSIWHDFFRFPLQVAHTLAKATTYQAFLPQGASTSSYIANLVFWDREPQLEAKLAQYGFFYTRYVDDINISSNERLDNKTLT